MDFPQAPPLVCMDFYADGTRATDPNTKIEFKPKTEDNPQKRKPHISKAKDLLGLREPNVSLRVRLPPMAYDFGQCIFGDHKHKGSGSNSDS
ncbi:hypothetical protein Nepgr_007405 [Nepenthes gracilis]|uniref:Uncharacterized protein n=1 Tax=Nepenthes gracilis TaxID=150966 RepID=A0AAD3XIE3_NEPGR|nr:hypothetical protein Nepgr_007405 [Nepenthes gracilis]